MLEFGIYFRSEDERAAFACAVQCATGCRGYLDGDGINVIWSYSYQSISPVREVAERMGLQIVESFNSFWMMGRSAC